jgi:phage replication O-like protein O
MCKLSGNATKVFMAIARKTIGWRKESDVLSNSQIQELSGIKSRNTLKDAIDELLKLEIIVLSRTGFGRGTESSYEINYENISSNTSKNDPIVKEDEKPNGSNSDLLESDNTSDFDPIDPVNRSKIDPTKESLNKNDERKADLNDLFHQKTSKDSSSCFEDLKKFGITQSQYDVFVISLKEKKIDPEKYLTDKLNQFKWLEKNKPFKFQKFKNKAAALCTLISENWIEKEYEDSKNVKRSKHQESSNTQNNKALKVIEVYKKITGIEMEFADDFQKVIARCELSLEDIEFIISETFERNPLFDLFELLSSPDIKTIYNNLKIECLKSFGNKIVTETNIEVKQKSKVG